MKAIEIMNEEHKYILRMLNVVRKVCFRIMNGEEIIYEDFNKIIDFIQNYADNHHHKKEEKVLFTKMVEHIGETAEKAVNQGMLVEHDLGRLHIRELVEALDKLKAGEEEAKLDVIANAISYSHLLTRHIDKEDRVIYKFAERNLKEETMQFVNLECENYEVNNEEIRNKYILLLEELEKKYGVRHLPSDFKKKNGYKRSIELSKEYDLYRQDFCGCVFSKRERDRREQEKSLAPQNR